MMASPIPTPDMTGIPLPALLRNLTPAEQRAYHHERRRGRNVIEALTFGVILPEVVEALMFPKGH